MDGKFYILESKIFDLWLLDNIGIPKHHNLLLYCYINKYELYIQ